LDFHDGNIFYFTDFDDNMERAIVLELTKEIQKQRRFVDGRLDLWINSFGGYGHLVFHLIELVEIAKRDGIVVRTIVPNTAFSAGSMLAITGSPGERYIARNAEHLIHYGNIGSQETTPRQIERMSAYKNRDFKATIEHYRKYAEVPDLDSEMMDDGWFLPAPKCIKYKLADKYIDKLDIGNYEG
jgi:ATP-dependent protease ClpP protease subunit